MYSDFASAAAATGVNITATVDDAMAKNSQELGRSSDYFYVDDANGASDDGGGGGGIDAGLNQTLSSATIGVDLARSFGGCFNSTLLEKLIRSIVRNATTLTREQKREIEGDPLVYIVAVLIFYSCGIAILMINYMKKEQNDMEETNLYKQYVDKRDRCNELNNRGRSLNRLALQALNAVNAISQDVDQSKVAFV